MNLSYDAPQERGGVQPFGIDEGRERKEDRIKNVLTIRKPVDARRQTNRASTPPPMLRRSAEGFNPSGKTKEERREMKGLKTLL